MMITVDHYSEIVVAAVVDSTKVNWRWPNFTPKEMADRESGRLSISPDFLDRLQTLRDRLRFPLIINSAYRTPERDKRFGGAAVHPQGCAVDIGIYGERAHRLLSGAMEMGFCGIGIKQHGPHGKRFIHLDDLVSDDHPRPWIWSY